MLETGNGDVKERAGWEVLELWFATRIYALTCRKPRNILLPFITANTCTVGKRWSRAPVANHTSSSSWLTRRYGEWFPAHFGARSSCTQRVDDFYGGASFGKREQERG